MGGENKGRLVLLDKSLVRGCGILANAGHHRGGFFLEPFIGCRKDAGLPGAARDAARGAFVPTSNLTFSVNKYMLVFPREFWAERSYWVRASS